MNAKEKYICGTCKHWDCDEDYCMASGNHEMYEQDSCDCWTDPAEPDQTEQERYDGGVMSNFDNENPKEVEDYINEKPV